MSYIVLAYQKIPRPGERVSLLDYYGVYSQERLTPRRAPHPSSPAGSVPAPPGGILYPPLLSGLLSGSSGRRPALRAALELQTSERAHQMAGYPSGRTGTRRRHLENGTWSRSLVLCWDEYYSLQIKKKKPCVTIISSSKMDLWLLVVFDSFSVNF